MTDDDQSIWVWPIQWVLWVISRGYYLGMTVHNYLYNQKILSIYKAPKPVISIGNITVGGAGKTPLTGLIIHHLRKQGLRPVIITRGYMPKGGADSSDEVSMLMEQFPHVPISVGPNRADSIRQAMVSMEPDVFVCDDAFVHRPLARDLDIVAVNSINPFGNGQMLLRGIVREPLAALKRADVIVLTKADVNAEVTQKALEKIIKYNAQAMVVEAHYRLVRLTDAFTDEQIPIGQAAAWSMVSFCGIADPEYFKHTVVKEGFDLKASVVFMDHHTYTSAEIEDLVYQCQMKNVNYLITTHKDKVKIVQFKDYFNGIRVIVAHVHMELGKNRDAFLDRINTVSRM